MISSDFLQKYFMKQISTSLWNSSNLEFTYSEAPNFLAPIWRSCTHFICCKQRICCKRGSYRKCRCIFSDFAERRKKSPRRRSNWGNVKIIVFRNWIIQAVSIIGFLSCLLLPPSFSSPHQHHSPWAFAFIKWNRGSLGLLKRPSCDRQLMRLCTCVSLCVRLCVFTERYIPRALLLL